MGLSVQRPSGVNVGVNNPDNTVYVKGNDITDGSLRSVPSVAQDKIDLQLRTAGVWATFLRGQDISEKSVEVVEVFDMTDFPAPVAGVITLPRGKYIIKAPITTSDRFVIESGAKVEFSSDNLRINEFNYTGTGTLFTATNFEVFQITDLCINCSGAGAQLFDMTGNRFFITSGDIFFTGGGATIGSLTGVSTIVILATGINGFTTGLTLTNIGAMLVDAMRMQADGAGTGSLFTFLTSIGIFVTIEGVLSIPGPSQSIFFIDPVITTAVNIRDSFNAGAGTFFEPGLTGLIASFTDVATAATAVTVSESGGNAIFTSVVHGLSVGETVVHTTFTEVGHNGTFVVTATPTADIYEIGLAFIAIDSGLYETTTVQVDDVGHGLANDTSVSIFGTLNFGGGYKTFNVQPNSFEITLGKVFPGNETTGNWDTGSLDASNKFVNAQDNGAESSSGNFAFGRVNENAVVTTIAIQDVYQAMDVTGLTSVRSELWTLIDPVDGIFRFDGLFPFSGLLLATISAVKSGSVQNYRFTQSIDSAIPVFATQGYTPIEVKSTKVQVVVVDHVDLSPGQTLQIMVAGDGTANNLTITDITFEIAG